MNDPQSPAIANSTPVSGQGDLTDEQLMVDFARGSAEAFQALFNRYNKPLFGFFVRRIADRSMADELTQETFVAIIRAAPRYEVTALFRTWLYAIAYKVLRSYRRKAFFNSEFLSAEVPEHSVGPTIETALFMREALRKLDRVEREILLLREFEQLSYAEIASLLQIPLNTVRSRLFRVRSVLRNLLMQPPARTIDPNLAITKEQA